MADAKPDLARAGTMQITAQEGISYLKDAKKDTLLELQGLAQREPEKPAVPRDSTMQVTAKEGEKLLADANIDPDAATRGQQKKLDEIAEEPAPAAKKPRMAKGVTMIATAKEANQLMGDKKPDQDAQTRGQQKKLDEIQAEKPSPAKKAPKLAKNTTMVATAKEGKALLENEKLGDTRAESQKKKGAPKRTTTMQKTMEEAKFVVGGGLDVSEGRRTRSASKPAPPAPLKKARTMQQTAKEGKEFLKRGRKPKKAAEPAPAEEDEEEQEEEAA